MKRHIADILFLIFRCFILVVILPAISLGQAPPPPPGGPGSGDPPIGGTVPVDDGVVFLIISALIYTGFKAYQYYLHKKAEKN